MRFLSKNITLLDNEVCYEVIYIKMYFCENARKI